MRTERLEAFTDGVMAILITIMVLEFRVPLQQHDFSALLGLRWTFLSYLLSFVYLGIYWNNHHHMFAVSQHVDGSVLWANLHLLFWLSMVPFVTAWMGENSFAITPTAVYGGVLLMSAIAYTILQRRILHLDGPDSVLAKAVGRDFKGRISLGLYLVAIPSAFISPWIAGALYLTVALMWIVPDRRIEAVAPDLTDAAK